MSKDSEQLEKEIQTLKDRIEQISSKKDNTLFSSDELSVIVKYMVEERERTNKTLREMTEKMKRLEGVLQNIYATEEDAESTDYRRGVENREVALSQLDTRIINFVQSSPNSMVCAEQVKEHMRYKGRNAACARLNKLHKDGLLERFQLGHKVYYKFDAGKTTNTLIISPPQ